MDTSKVVRQFLGDDEFPIEWQDEREKKLLWVYDDLHCPHPLSPMFFDIGGWWLSCDHMFRRFGTPFASDWIAKNVNGYLYTAAVPADPDFAVPSKEYNSLYTPRVPRDDVDYPSKIGGYMDAVLPVYGLNFADWWQDRLVPEMRRNLDYLEERIRIADDIDLMEWAVILEDAIDIHDRHWKIHWMLNFAQFSATLNLRAAMEEVKGDVDEELLGRLQNSAQDRNWDAIESLWRMKEIAKVDPEIGRAFSQGGGAQILAALEGTSEGTAFIEEHLRPYQREFGWHAVWSHEFIFPTRFEQAAPVIDVIKSYLESDYDFPSAVAELASDIADASDELLEGVEGEDLERLRKANEVNLRMAPLTPDHHFYIDQGTNAHLRVVLLCIGGKLTEEGAIDKAEDILFLKYNELRYLIGDLSEFDARSIILERRAERDRALGIKPRDWIGTATESQLEFPYLNNWGFPDRLFRDENVSGTVSGIAGSPGVVEGTAKVVLSINEFDEVRKGDILVCQMTNPAWTPLFAMISGIVTDTGGTTSHPAVMAREFAIPAVLGTSVATTQINSGDKVRVDGTTGVVELL